jgi:hypothetical protein
MKVKPVTMIPAVFFASVGSLIFVHDTGLDKIGGAIVIFASAILIYQLIEIAYRR